MKEKVKDLFRSKQLLTAEIARKSRVTPAAVRNWMNGESKPSYNHIKKLAEILSVSESDLIDLFYEDSKKGISEFSRRLKKERKRLGLSQTEIANAIHFKHKTAFSQWETGRSMPNLKNFVELCFFLGVSANYLLGLDELEDSDSRKIKSIEKILRNEE